MSTPRAASGIVIPACFDAETRQPVADLTVVGTGIRALGQITLEAVVAVQQSEDVWFLVGDELSADALRTLNPAARSLRDLYAENKPRLRTYEEMAERIVSSVRAGRRTCAVFYGHPGVFVDPAHRAVRMVREEGRSARMLPGVSAEDCLFADLGVDPGVRGCQAYEATAFLLYHHVIELSAPLLLWQIGVIGEWNYPTGEVDRTALGALVGKLTRSYPPDHPVTLYEAAIDTGSPPRRDRLPCYALTAAEMSPSTTLYVPPLHDPFYDPAAYLASGLAPAGEPGTIGAWT